MCIAVRAKVPNWCYKTGMHTCTCVCVHVRVCVCTCTIYVYMTVCVCIQVCAGNTREDLEQHNTQTNNATKLISPPTKHSLVYTHTQQCTCICI